MNDGGCGRGWSGVEWSEVQLQGVKQEGDGVSVNNVVRKWTCIH